MTECKYLIDSSIWVSHFLSEKEEIKKFFDESNEVFISILSLFEVHKKFIREKHNPHKVQIALELMQQRSGILPVTQAICQKAAQESIQNDLAAMDALIYATAQHHNLILVTGDNDFRKLKDVKII